MIAEATLSQAGSPNRAQNEENAEVARDPNIDDAISLLTFNTLNTQLLNTIQLPLDKVPTSTAYEQQDAERCVIEQQDLEHNESSSFNTNMAIISRKEEETEKGYLGSPVGENKEEELNLDEVSLVDPPYTCYSRWQIAVIFSVIVFIGFLGPMAGNIYIPALPLLQTEFNVGTTTINSTVSVFMAVFSIGPLIWGFYADLTGRKFLYIISLALLVVVNILLAAVPSNIVALYILRIFQAFGSSSVISLGTGTVTDIIPPKHRGKSIAYFMMGPNMGPILAPIFAGLILMKGEHWRWLFGFTSIMSGIALLLVIAILPETLRCIVGNGDPKWLGDNESTGKPKLGLCTNLGIQRRKNEDPQFTRAYPKPPKPTLKMYWEMLKFPPLLIVSMSSAMLFTNYYGFSVTFSHFLQSEYHYSMLSVGIAYVCPGVSMLLGSQIGGHLSDYMRQRWLKTHNNQTFPLEYRLYLQIWGIGINTVGCIGYGWAIQRHYHVVVIFVFSAFNAFGLTWSNNTTMTYLSELMARRVSGAIAVSSFLRNIGATISSAIVIRLCQEMGIGWCFTGLGLCNILSFLAICYLIRHQRRSISTRSMKQLNV
ncbi:hypothetical protein HG535_0H02700 [Zygotorulaspora mrakii]|uniref:Major facilitator superfamily (MFS) profile domain-containing protein n=1 Tax=Zygotorulaspora mrakii TaxID=42260 RepID=A0A7H9B8U2_ZYGMR|nr:uncharacterized protein HG535_0H02700 [Zygotorulaspora mrakii]QLG74943.1 hypothetical protein HG535_0H02700 [Zygotorulaspora mrakii]